MPYKITNVSLAHEHAMKRRSAAKMHMEPMIAGQRLLLRSSRILTDEQYEVNKPWLAEYEKHGVVTVEKCEPRTSAPKKAEEKKEVSAPPAPVKDEVPPPPPASIIEAPPPPPAPQPEQSRKDSKKQGK